MAQVIRIKMHGKEENVAFSDNFVTESSIIRAFGLSLDDVVKLCYEYNGMNINCESRIVPEPCFILPINSSTLQFYADPSRKRRRSSSPTDQNKPCYPAVPPEPAPTSKAFIKWMFYLHSNYGKATAICVHPRFFSTFRHGSHQQFNLGDKMKIYRAEKEVDEQEGIDVSVANINESLDFVILRSDIEVVEHAPIITDAQDAESFTLAGFENDKGHISYAPGAIHYVRDYYFENGVRKMGPFIMGNCQSSRGDSGGGVWGAQGLIGMNFGTTMMPLQSHHEAISEAAVFSKKNIICPAMYIKAAVLVELQKEKPAEQQEEKVSPPPPKRVAVMTEIDGIGRLFGKEG